MPTTIYGLPQSRQQTSKDVSGRTGPTRPSLSFAQNNLLPGSYGQPSADLLHRACGSKASIAPLAFGLAQVPSLEKKRNTTLTPDIYDHFVHPTKPGQQQINVVFFSPEAKIGKTGGLGEVTGDIPPEIAGRTPIDMRVFTPFCSPLQQAKTKDGKPLFQSTGLTIKVPGKLRMPRLSRFIANRIIGNLFSDARKETFLNFARRKHPFTVMQDTTNPMFYALSNPQYVDRFKNMFFNYQLGVTKEDDENAGENIKETKRDAFILMNRAMKMLVPYLDGKQLPNSSAELQPFEGTSDVMVMNDWPTTLSLHDGLNKELPDLKTLFYLHNTYDEYVALDDLKAFMDVPSRMNTVNNPWTSLISAGFDGADGIIANINYTGTILASNFRRGAGYLPSFRNKFESGRVYDMHHSIAPDFTPTLEPNLHNNEFGFRPMNQPELSLVQSSHRSQDLTLKSQAAERIQSFKDDNKLAFQEMTSKQSDADKAVNGYLDAGVDDAVLFGWRSRLDPNQKGYLMVQSAMKKLLTDHPNAQIAIIGSGNIPGLDEFRKEMLDEFPGRFYMPNASYGPPQDCWLAAASDFSMMPSAYEPFGVTMLKSMEMFSVPLATAVDGQRSALSDDDARFANMTNGPAEILAKYGPTARLMQLDDVPSYCEAMAILTSISAKQKEGLADGTYTYDYNQRFNQLNDRQQRSMNQANDAFAEVLERAMALTQEPKKFNEMRVNGHEYVNGEHTPTAISARYFDLFYRLLRPDNQPFFSPQAQPVAAFS